MLLIVKPASMPVPTPLEGPRHITEVVVNQIDETHDVRPTTAVGLVSDAPKFVPRRSMVIVDVE
jgi:hypothetical protein